jgi:hypothetical protein
MIPVPNTVTAFVMTAPSELAGAIGPLTGTASAWRHRALPPCSPPFVPQPDQDGIVAPRMQDLHTGLRHAQLLQQFAHVPAKLGRFRFAWLLVAGRARRCVLLVARRVGPIVLGAELWDGSDEIVVNGGVRVRGRCGR